MHLIFTMNSSRTLRVKNYKILKVKTKMGLYDTISIYMQCPYCKISRVFDAQTKDLGRLMLHYKASWWSPDEIQPWECIRVLNGFVLERDLKESSFPSIDCEHNTVHMIADCHSSLCQWYADRRDVKNQGVPSGFGRIFEFEIPIVEIKGKKYLIGKPLNIKLVDDLSDEELSDWEDYLEDSEKDLYEKALQKFKYPPLALRFRYLCEEAV